MTVNHEHVTVMASVLADVCKENSDLRYKLASAQRDYDNLCAKHAEKQTEACPPSDRILPPCLRWTKDRPLNVTAWRIGIGFDLLCFAPTEKHTTDPVNGWLSFAEDTR